MEENFYHFVRSINLYHFYTQQLEYSPKWLRGNQGACHNTKQFIPDVYVLKHLS